jgi:hypothetical protein
MREGRLEASCVEESWIRTSGSMCGGGLQEYWRQHV